jgi:hypothetical protein
LTYINRCKIDNLFSSRWPRSPIIKVQRGTRIRPVSGFGLRVKAFSGAGLGNLCASSADRQASDAGEYSAAARKCVICAVLFQVTVMVPLIWLVWPGAPEAGTISGTVPLTCCVPTVPLSAGEELLLSFVVSVRLTGRLPQVPAYVTVRVPLLSAVHPVSVTLNGMPPRVPLAELPASPSAPQ